MGTSAWYAPGAAAAQMVDSIMLDEKRVLPCTAYLEGEYGIDGLYMGVPCKLGPGGIEEIVELDLSDDEQAALEGELRRGPRGRRRPHHVGRETALVTGVSRRAGIGFAIARRLQEAGRERLHAGLDAARREHSRGAPTRTARTVDSRRTSPTRTRRRASSPPHARALGPLDILVVNHARSGTARLDELTAEHLDAFLHENVRASLLLVKEFAAQLEAGPGASSCCTSGAHLAPMTGEVAYAVSKGALAVATATLADELAGRAASPSTASIPARPTRAGASPSWTRGPDALRPLGRAGRRGAARRLAVRRRRALDHRAGDRLRGRLSPLDD